MALDKAIRSGKEHRKPYRRAAAIDSHCRHGRPCSWCQGNRQYQNKKLAQIAKEELRKVAAAR